ncbi:60s ribosomal protein l6 [Holotrichia oblita]|uniref:60s ribosomal protein l6 n=2 Tax=Holotrichia oblita TaxID=644536 RepID=A0ACB9SGR9_HOLOL|nr:60s ribosomal protein l6 [Holotrichia oblita]KAI4454347.1 60s ribosomal protein l6 [Holotrichia oblita]
MAPTEPKPATGDKKPDEKKPKIGKPRNYDLGNGIYRFSRTRVYHKKALYKFVGKKVAATKKPVKALTAVKPIGGEKNGEKRVVLLKKRRNYYPTEDKISKRPAKKCFKQHKRSLRTSIKPGTILILLAGPHKGKRVVFLKQLYSGLLLITGPFKINACPLRRISQRYVIGTQTRIDISGVKIPDTIDDTYFRRERKKRAKKEEGDIFSTKKESYKVSDQRKADQKIVDKEIIGAIKKNPERKLLYAYLATMFGLRSSQYPHRMKF